MTQEELFALHEKYEKHDFKVLNSRISCCTCGKYKLEDEYEEEGHGLTELVLSSVARFPYVMLSDLPPKHLKDIGAMLKKNNWATNPSRSELVESLLEGKFMEVRNTKEYRRLTCRTGAKTK